MLMNILEAYKLWSIVYGDEFKPTANASILNWDW